MSQCETYIVLSQRRDSISPNVQHFYTKEEANKRLMELLGLGGVLVGKPIVISAWSDKEGIHTVLQKVDERTSVTAWELV